MKFFYLQNLSSAATCSDVLPWEFKPAQPVPDEARKDKKFRDSWINAPATRHYVYSFIEGVNPNQRVSKLRDDGGGNPPHAIHALVADYDSPEPKEKMLEQAKNLPYAPNWMEHTLSGNWRFIWLLEEPLILPSFAFARHFLKKFADFAFDPARGMFGFDKKAWEAPERLWTNSCEWLRGAETPIPKEVSLGWLVAASSSFDFQAKDFGTVVPLDVVKSALAKKYPTFAGWPGEFLLNEQGPTFWVPESASPKSAIIRETGIQTFSAHAPKGFYSWADLLGIDFVKEYDAAALGRAVEGIYFDGKFYWEMLPSGDWAACDAGELNRFLRVSRGVSHRMSKGETCSDVERAIEFVRRGQRVKRAAPFLYQPRGLLRREGKLFLNTSSVSVLPPAEGVAIWGPEGQFPWVSQLLTLFPGAAFDIVRAWGARAYHCGYHQQPESGQILFMAGPVGIGKTLINRGVFGALMGGFGDPSAFFMGDDLFNSELFDCGYWAMDDGSVTADNRSMRNYSSTLKKIAANGEVRCNGKYEKATLAEWKGRVCITCNADPESMKVLPDTSISILDKLLLVRTMDKAPCVFPSQPEIKAILARELPWFARWLLDWDVPAHLLGDSRYGITAYHDPALLDTSRQTSYGSAFNELLHDWRETYFSLLQPDAEAWSGTVHQLYQQLSRDEQNAGTLRSYPIEAVTRLMQGMETRDTTITQSSANGMRVFTFKRPANLSPLTKQKL